MDKISVDEAKAYELMSKEAGFKIVTLKKDIDFNSKEYEQLNLDGIQKSQLNALLNQVPAVAATGTLANAYSVSFPKGLPHTLTALNQGGFGSMIRDNGKFVGSASFYPLRAQAFALGAFTVVSAVTGQYFLAEINKKLGGINSKLDAIQKFLYADKRAELISELSFIKYAYDNYGLLLSNETQRIATLTNIQEAKKVAIKDMEFYRYQLYDNSALYGKYTEKEKKIYNEIDLMGYYEASLQLYVMSGILEIFFSQNYNEAYVSYMRDDMLRNIKDAEDDAINLFEHFKKKLYEHNEDLVEFFTLEVGKKKKIIRTIDAHINGYKKGEDSAYRKTVHEALDLLNQKDAIYIDKDRDIYVKKPALTDLDDEE